MQKVVIKGPQNAEIVEVPTPKPKLDWVLVKIKVAPMCTEYQSYKTGQMDFPLGHEAAGEVVAMDQSVDLEIGDRVVVMPQYPCGKCALCLSGEYIHCEDIYDIEQFTGSPEGSSTYAQYILKPAWLLPKIPANISYEHASMLCCGLGPTFGAMERMQVSAFDTVLITGMGPVGLGGVINAVYRGARVIAVVRNPYRSKLARDLGANPIINPNDKNVLQEILENTNGKGVDKVIECTGDSSAQRLAIEATKRHGAIAFVGESGDLNIKISDDLIRNGLTLHGIWHYNLNDIPKLFQIIEKSKNQLDKLITHSFPMSQVNEAWNVQLTGQCGKVILYP